MVPLNGTPLIIKKKVVFPFEVMACFVLLFLRILVT